MINRSLLVKSSATCSDWVFLKRAREGHCNPDEEEIYAKFINHPFVKYAEKLGYERYLAYDALLQKDEEATTETLLMTVLQTYDSGLLGRRYHTF